MQLELEQQQPYILFSSSIRSDETRKTYTLLLKKFIEYLGEGDILLGSDSKQIERKIIDFIMSLKEQGKQYSAINNYVSAITASYKINDIILNVTKISKFMPQWIQSMIIVVCIKKNCGRSLKSEDPTVLLFLFHSNFNWSWMRKHIKYW